ncbi:MAG: asparagine synthase (glutamine-hydrolyzing) [Pyrinomonadaceae bacterium]
MCSIAGIITVGERARGEQSPSNALEGMIPALHHRGPDDNGIWIKPDSNRNSTFIGLGNTRLAIIDLSPAGHQPMVDSDAGACLTYNGEMYNFQTLRKELDDTSRDWKSHTDTEVVLRAYERWGVPCLEKFRGMFALALWDGRERKLLLARDALGIKPLYYYQTKNLFIFASEVRALLASGLVPRRLSRTGLASYLEYGSVESPETIIEGVRSLLPGHCMIVKPSEEEISVDEKTFNDEVFEPPPQTRFVNREKAVERLREVLQESVRLHLVSDVPLGVFLSGGMDSSAIVALMSQVAGERVKSFSVTFAEKKFTEATHARTVAEMFGTDHREIPLSEDGLLEMLPEAMRAIDQPTMDGINTFVVSKSVRQAGITVALSGLGGDELFAGYSTFRRFKKLQSLSPVPQGLRSAVSTIGSAVLNNSVQRRKFWQLVESDGSPRAAYAVTRQLFSVKEIDALLKDIPSRSKVCYYEEALDSINAVSLCELQGYMTNTLLRDTDFMSMAHSLEVRVPFVDSEVVRFVLSIPGEWKMNGGRAKPLLQDALKDLLPEDLMQRPKMGFTLPFENWMQSRLRSRLDEVFLDEEHFKHLGLRGSVAKSVWQRFLQSPRRVGWSRPWALYVLANWCQLHQVSL